MTTTTTTTTRLVSAVAALLVNLATVQMIANYALPQVPAMQLASAHR